VNQLETLKLIDKFRAEAKAAIAAERERCAKIADPRQSIEAANGKRVCLWRL
jgi:hypothetical protein